ncbi:MAG TPA: FAD/NAD(P)-binding oxidoreductase [Gemmatimonadaceae bacterium]|nr:FAD/NAD(P)-binding oxidoreductase [Gemmatimonadaceae bacterium]
MSAVAGSAPSARPASGAHETRADIVVVGAGPAGIAAAVRATEARRRVVVLDEAPNVGGQIWRHRSVDTLGTDARAWVDRLARTSADVRRGVAAVDVVVGGDSGDVTVVAERHLGGVDVIRASALVIATGARERFVPFPGWTLPGVTGIGGAQALLKQGATLRGKRVVIAGTGPLILPVAASLTDAGARVVLVAEQAPFQAVRDFALSLLTQPETLLQAAMYRLAFLRTPYAMGTWVTAASGTDRLTAVTVANSRTTWTLPCDLLCTGYGLVPNVEMARFVGCTTADGAVVVDDHQGTSVPPVFAAGELTGIGGVALAVTEGEIAGAAAAGVARVDPSLSRRRQALRIVARRMERAFALRQELRSLARDDTIICRCEDVRRAAIASFADSRQAKLYARAGMGACQGRVCGPALELLFGWQPGTVRSPLEPARLATLSTAALAGAASPDAVHSAGS